MTKRQKQGGDQIKDSLSVLLKEKLNDYFDHLKKEQKERSIEQKMHIYKIEPNELNSDPTISAFSPVDGYWMKDVQQERFDDGESRGILYRPKIVKEMMKVVDDTFNKNRRGGIMIKGPHGIGKSHSLVNLVRTLQYDSSCKYLVTFIPDCDRWECVGDLYTAICSSFGTTLTALMWQIGSDLDEQLVSLNNFVKAIDLILRRMDRRWVLVFDQVNRLFYRPVLDKADDLGTLPFPFSAINNIMKRGRRIVSIISASTDNEVAYKARRQGIEGLSSTITLVTWI